MAERLSAVTGYRRRKCSLFSGTADPILLPNPHSVRKREWVHVVAYLHGVCVGIRGEPDKGVKSVCRLHSRSMRASQFTQNVFNIEHTVADVGVRFFVLHSACLFLINANVSRIQ